jgi:alpha-ribazole phosphatase
MSAGWRFPSPDCTILLVRHAHVEMAGRFCGVTNPPLSPQGREQAAKLAEELAKHPPTRIFSSDLLRAQETAQCIASRTALSIELLPSLREMHFGAWEGLNWDEVTKQDAPYATRWMAEFPLLPAPGGEEFVHFRQRVRSALAEVTARAAGGRAVVVTHGGAIRTLMLDVLRVPERELASIACDYACWFQLQLRSGECFCAGRSGLHQVQTN